MALRDKVYKHILYLIEDTRDVKRIINCQEEADQILHLFAEWLRGNLSQELADELIKELEAS